jgi:uncharacterized membrane protein YuzA (DUF378 family)
MKYFKIAAVGLLVVAGLNCGLIALFQYDMIAANLGASFGPVVLSRLLFGLIGIAALYEVANIMPLARAAAR